MNTSIQFGPADRDERGFVKAPAPPQEPRSLTDLLPTPQSIQADASRRKPPASKAEQALRVAAALLAIGVVAWRIGFGGGSIPAAPQSAPATAQPSGDGAPKPSPLPAAAPAIAGRLLIAFAAPDGTALGAIESTRAITPTAHYGATWIQADVAGSGLVWLRAADTPELAIIGPDLAPRPTAIPAPAPAYVPPTPEPQPPCAQAGIPGKMVEVCGWGDLDALAHDKWIATYGGNVGIVTTPTPYGGTR